jgi:DNA-binding winged helix-turn-helix (wHTH) protein/tetratricopeptide (TPR) repeat protein
MVIGCLAGDECRRDNGSGCYRTALVPMNGFLLPVDSPPCGYWFAGFRLEADGRLVHGRVVESLPPEELAALRLLLVRAGEVVSPTELQRAVWGDTSESAGAVTQCVASLRARLAPANCIQTVSKRGYRISVAVRADGQLPAGTLPSLAVPPFTTGCGIPEYRGTAVTEKVMEQLSDPRGAVASIAARDSAFALARRGMAAREIGETLQVDLVLSGTLKASYGGDRLHAEMIRVHDGAQLWIEDLIAKRGRIEELVQRVTSRLHGDGLFLFAAAELAEDDETASLRSEANELFQRAHHEWLSLERHRMQDGLGQFQHAIELDPKLTAARVDLGHLSIVQTFYGFMAPKAAADLVRRTAWRAPEMPEALLPPLGWISFHVDHDLRTALKDFARASSLIHEPWTTLARSILALSRHRFDEALGLLHAAIAFDPYSHWLQPMLAWGLHLAGEASASVAQIRKAMEMFPGHDGCQLYGAIILAFNDEAAEAVKLARAIAERSPSFDIAVSVHAYTLACAGHGDEARELLERLEWLSRERFVLNTFNAAAYVALGELEAALAELRTSFDNRCPWFFQTLADPRLKPLEGKPEFVAMRAKLAAMEAKARDAVE